MGIAATCYDCGRYDYRNECCINFDYANPDDGACEDFVPVGDYECDSIGYEDDGYPD